MEIDYTKHFSKMKEYQHYYEFSDEKLPGMYVHNFIMFKENINPAIVYNTIKIQLQKRKANKADFLRVEFNHPVNLSFIDKLIIKPDVEVYDYMMIETSKFDELKGNAFGVLKLATNDTIYEDGRIVDIEANKKDIGRDFATRRIQRKLISYKGYKTLEFYVCYVNNIAIGNCEFCYNDEVVKIEDFDILKAYQRKGYGTYVLKELLHKAFNKGLSNAYVITESNDIAKDMYKKCGLVKVGEKTELIFDF